MVAFEQFTRPALLQMMGSEKLFRPSPTAPLGGAETDPAKTVFRVRTWWMAATLYAESSGGQPSNVLSAPAAADAFAVVPEGVSNVPAGGPVTLELFRPPSPAPPRKPLANERAGPAMTFSHLDEHGHVHMVDVGDKDVTARTAVAEGAPLSAGPETSSSRDCCPRVTPWRRPGSPGSWPPNGPRN